MNCVDDGIENIETNNINNNNSIKKKTKGENKRRRSHYVMESVSWLVETSSYTK